MCCAAACRRQPVYACFFLWCVASIQADARERLIDNITNIVETTTMEHLLKRSEARAVIRDLLGQRFTTKELQLVSSRGRQSHSWLERDMLWRLMFTCPCSRLVLFFRSVREWRAENCSLAM
jgi:hypothetical protein